MFLRNSFAFIILIVLASCAGTDEPLSDVFNIDTEFTLSLSQSLSATGPKMVIELSSIALNHCKEDQLIIDLSQNSQHIGMNIQGLERMSECDDPIYAVQENIELALNNGNYLFSLDIGNTIDNSGTLNVEEDLFRINLLSTTGIVIDKSTIKKIPTGMIWGRITAPLSLGNQEYELRNDIQSLSLSDQAQSQLIGDYGFMQINQTGELFFAGGFDDLSETESGDLFFDHIDPASLESLLLVINTYRENYPELEIQMFDWAGNQY